MEDYILLYQMVSRKTYETELGDMDQNDLFARCKELELKNCRKNMTKITLQNKIIAGEPWKSAKPSKKSSGKKPAEKPAKKPSAKKPAEKPAKKSSAKKSSAKKSSAKKCKDKVCDPGTICDINKGICRKRTKAGKPYGAKKLEEVYDDYFFYDEDDDYLILGTKDDVENQLKTWGVKRPGKMPKPVDSDDEPPPKKPGKKPGKKPKPVTDSDDEPPRKKPGKKPKPVADSDEGKNLWSQKVVGCRDPFGDVICGEGKYKDLPHCGVNLGKCMKGKGNVSYETVEFNDRIFIGKPANIALLRKFIGKRPDPSLGKKSKPSVVDSDEPVETKNQRKKRERHERLLLEREARWLKACAIPGNQDKCDEYYESFLKLRKVMGVTGKLKRLSVPKAESSDSPSEFSSGSDIDVVPVHVSSDDPVVDILSSDDPPEIVSSDDPPEIVSSDDPEPAVQKPVKKDDDIQRAFTKCLAML